MDSEKGSRIPVCTAAARPACHYDDWDLGSASQGLHCGEPTHGYPWLSLVFSAADTLSYHDPVDSVPTLAN